MLIVLLPLCPPTLFAFCLHFIIITFTLNDELVICSLNVRGLSNPLKRRETFRWLKMKKYGIFFLQEVHCTKEKESLWTSEWGFTAFFSSFSSARARVCILFNNNFQFEIIRQFSDQEGRYIIIDMKIDKILTLVNISAPNNDNPTFFKIFSIKSSLLNVKKLLWEATLIWSWTFRRIKKEETRQCIEIRSKRSRT